MKFLKITYNNQIAFRQSKRVVKILCNNSEISDKTAVLKMQLGDIVLYNGGKYKIVWIYNEENLEIKSLEKAHAIPEIIPVHISKIKILVG